MDINEKVGIARNFIVIPEHILGIKELSPTDKLVYARIVGFEEYYESQEHCAEFLGINARAVGEAKRKLEKMGLIECVENTGRGKIYKASLDQDFQKTESRVPKFVNQSSEICKSDFRNLEIYNKDNNKVNNKDKSISESKNSDSRKISQDAYELAEFLKQTILISQPTAHIDRNYLENWAKDIDKAIRLDGRTFEALKAMITYCYEVSDFWGQNIRSGAKLRKHYDRIEMEIKNYYMKHGTIVVGGDSNDSSVAPF